MSRNFISAIYFEKGNLRSLVVDGFYKSLPNRGGGGLFKIFLKNQAFVCFH